MRKKAIITSAMTANQVKTELRAIDAELALINPRKCELEERRKVLVAVARDALLGFQEILAETEETITATLGGTSIDSVGFGIRITNRLYEAGIRTVEKLLSTSRRDLLAIKRLGPKGVSDIKYALREKGYESSQLEEPK